MSPWTYWKSASEKLGSNRLVGERVTRPLIPQFFTVPAFENRESKHLTVAAQRLVNKPPCFGRGGFCFRYEELSSSPMLAARVSMRRVSSAMRLEMRRRELCRRVVLGPGFVGVRRKCALP